MHQISINTTWESHDLWEWQSLQVVEQLEEHRVGFTLHVLPVVLAVTWLFRASMSFFIRKMNTFFLIFSRSHYQGLMTKDWPSACICNFLPCIVLGQLGLQEALGKIWKVAMKQQPSFFVPGSSVQTMKLYYISRSVLLICRLTCMVQDRSQDTSLAALTFLLDPSFSSLVPGPEACLAPRHRAPTSSTI